MGSTSAAFDNELCTNAELQDAVTAYAFDDLEHTDRERVALHVIECDQCWRELRQLEECIAVLSHDVRLNPLQRSPDVLSAIGLAGRVDQTFAGHAVFAIAVSSLFGALWAASVWTELSYSYSAYVSLIWLLTPVAFLGASAALGATLYVIAQRAASNHASGLAQGSVWCLGGLGVLTLLLALSLPDVQTIAAAFETRSAAGGYVKNVGMYFVPLLLFVLPTFDAVVQLQRHLRAGRHQAVLDLLSRQPHAVAPRGVWILPGWFLVLVLSVAVIVGYQGVHHLLDNLRPGPFAQLFSLALYVRVGLWFLIALIALAWHHAMLNELKREAAIGSKLLGTTSERPQ
jgi:hypothetical protein